MRITAYDWPQGGTKQIAYANAGAATSGGNGGHIIELFVGVGNQPPWSWADLTTITGAPLASEISGIVGYAWPAGNTKQVVYTDVNGHIIELLVGVGGQPPWSWADLTAITGAPQGAIGNPASAYVWSAENTKQVVYTDLNNHIIELVVGVGGQWSWADLTTITGAPLCRSVPVGYDWPAGNTKQVVYLDENDHIIELFVGVGGGWTWADLTTITGAPLPLGGVTAYSWSAGNTKQVVYEGVGGQLHIIELVVGVGGQWSWADLTTITGAPPAAYQAKVAGYDWPRANRKQVVYEDGNHHIIQLFVGVGGNPPWSSADLTAITGAPALAATGDDIAAYLWSAQESQQVVHIGYIPDGSGNARLIELLGFVFEGVDWTWADLTTVTGTTLGL